MTQAARLRLAAALLLAPVAAAAQAPPGPANGNTSGWRHNQPTQAIVDARQDRSAATIRREREQDAELQRLFQELTRPVAQTASDPRR